MSSTLPTEKRQLRACMICSLVKNQHQFRQYGCENCEDIVSMKGSLDKVLECTSSNFDGMVAMMRPTDSWVARWQRVDKFTKGIYAIRVYGILPEDVVDTMKSMGIEYWPRDGTGENLM